MMASLFYTTASSARMGREPRSPEPAVSIAIRGGTIYDGLGGEPFLGDILVANDRIVAVVKGGSRVKSRMDIDARGLAIAPGFINMLSWANESLLVDGRAMSDIKQGVTLEILGEGESMGPLTPDMKHDMERSEGDLKYPVTWTTLGEYLEHTANKGIAPNVASFVGAATVRIHELGKDDVDPTPAQLGHMRGLVRQGMREGALGVSSALIYAPGAYAETPELVALAREAALCGGIYISHIRSEGDRLLPAIDELIDISRESGAPAEIYHLKQAGRTNWGKISAALARIEAARAQGLRITADMYSYTAGASGLDAAMPPWVQAGGYDAWVKRLKDPQIRARVVKEMSVPAKDWENLYLAAGGADNVLLIGFKNPDLKKYTGKTLAEVATALGVSPIEAAIDLVIKDGSRVSTAYFMMDEANVRRQVGLPWVAFGSDESAPASKGVFLLSNSHPRAYGNVARLLGHYVREEKATTLQSAIQRLTSFPAKNLGIRDRGSLAAGNYADLVVFDPQTIGDHATYAQPAQYASGVRDVFVNGIPVLRNGQATGRKAGQVVRGPGWQGWANGGECR